MKSRKLIALIAVASVLIIAATLLYLQPNLLTGGQPYNYSGQVRTCQIFNSTETICGYVSTTNSTDPPIVTATTIVTPSTTTTTTFLSYNGTIQALTSKTLPVIDAEHERRLSIDVTPINASFYISGPLILYIYQNQYFSEALEINQGTYTDTNYYYTMGTVIGINVTGYLTFYQTHDRIAFSQYFTFTTDACTLCSTIPVPLRVG